MAAFSVSQLRWNDTNKAEMISTPMTVLVREGNDDDDDDSDDDDNDGISRAMAERVLSIVGK